MSALQDSLTNQADNTRKYIVAQTMGDKTLEEEEIASMYKTHMGDLASTKGPEQVHVGNLDDIRWNWSRLDGKNE